MPMRAATCSFGHQRTKSAHTTFMWCAWANRTGSDGLHSGTTSGEALTARETYEAEKTRLASLHRDDREAYTAGKSEVIGDLLAKAQGGS